MPGPTQGPTRRGDRSTSSGDATGTDALVCPGFAESAGWTREDPPDDNRPRLAPRYDGPLRESRTGLYRASLEHPRRIGEGHPRTESVASTAILRHDRLPSYRPRGLSAYLDRRGRRTDLDPDFKSRGFDCP